MFTFPSVGHGGHSVELKLCLTRNLRSTRVKETAIQNLAKPPWFKLHTVFITCKACNNVHVWFSHVAYWNCRQFSIITRLENSSLVLLGRTSSRCLLMNSFNVKIIWNNSYLYCGCRWKWNVIIAVNFPI